MYHYPRNTTYNMQRDKLKELQNWKYSDLRKPLIVRGARQVGKTWLLKEFGRIDYQQCIYVNFEDSPNLKSLFLQDFQFRTDY